MSDAVGLFAPPPVGAGVLGQRADADWVAVARDLHGLHLTTAPAQRRRLSRDYHWYSPILAEQLAACEADLVVRPSTEAEVLRIAAVAAHHRVPITVRGAGTGNYGQCMPLARGLVLDTTEMVRVLELAPGRVRVQAGAKLMDVELAARESGQALRMWPSTWRVATVAGFVAGGFGGVGSTRHGVLRDPGNMLSARVVTVEREPRIVTLTGDEIQQVHHAFGTNGIVTEMTLALSPAVEWVHTLALFEDYGALLATAQAAGAAEPLPFLLSAVDRRFSPYYRTLLGDRFPPDRHALFAMVDPAGRAAFERSVAAHGGVQSLAGTEAELEAAGLPPAWECAYNHTTLHALKADAGPDRAWTYLQVAYPQPFDPAVVLRQMARWGDSVLQHQEFARMAGAPATFAMLLVRWQGAAHQAALIRDIEADGCTIFNPHVVTIEDGGMKTIDDAQIAFKRRADPLGLMNPGKTRGWTPAMAQR